MSATPAAPPSYLDLLRIPGALGFVLPAAVGRLPQSMIGIGTVLMIAALQGSYALAGAVAAVMALAQGGGAPLAGRLADRWGQARVVLATTAIFVPALSSLVLLATIHAPTVTLFVAAIFTGATIPVLGVFSRVRWSRLTQERGGWDRALALESVIDETTYIIGPVLATVLAVGVAPQAGLVVAVVLAAVGVLWFMTARSTHPRPTPLSRTGRRAARPAIAEPGMVGVALVLVALGALFGSVDVVVVAFTEAAGQPSAAALVIGGFSLSSLIGGVLYGQRRWRSAPQVRFAWSATAVGVSMLLMPFVSNVALLAIGLGLAGFAVASTLIGGNALISLLVPPEVLTEGFTWLGVAIVIGVAVGAPVTGAAADEWGARAALLVLPVIGLLTVGLAWLAARSVARVVIPTP